jgi:hypothetical protein
MPSRTHGSVGVVRARVDFDDANPHAPLPYIAFRRLLTQAHAQEIRAALGKRQPCAPRHVDPRDL